MLSLQTVERFRALLARELGEEVSTQAARDQLVTLVRFFSTLARYDAMDQRHAASTALGDPPQITDLPEMKGASQGIDVDFNAPDSDR